MKSSMELLLLSFLVLGLSSGNAARPAHPSSQSVATASQASSGTYKIFDHNKEIGFEHFELSTSGGKFVLSSDGQTKPEGVPVQIKSSLTLGQNGPVHYSVETGTGSGLRKYLIDFDAGQAKAMVESGGHSTERDVKLQNDFQVVLLDKDVWSQYRFLFAKYDMAQKGIQTFQAFVPVPALKYLKAEVEFDKPLSYDLGKEKISANRFFVRLGDALGLIAIVAPDGSPLSIEVPTKEIKVTLEAVKN
jgi:hypothetical protein